MTETKKKTLWAELRRIAKAVRAEYGEEAYARAVEGEPSLHDGLSPYEAFNFTTLDADAARAAYSAYKKLLDASPAKADATTRKAVMQQAMTTRAAQYTTTAQVCVVWVWVMGVKRFVRRRDGTMWDVQQFNSAFDYLVRRGFRSISAELFANDQGLLKKFELITFAPGRAELDGESYNTWRASNIVPAVGDTAPWDAHLAWLFPDPLQRALLLDWMAWVYQNPTRRPGNAVLLLGETMGTGKSIVARLMEQLIGPTNTRRPKNSSLKGDFNSYAFKVRLVLIEELMQIGRREVANELRDLITEPTVEINIKNVPQFEAPNFSALFAVSNNPDALPMVKGDRRWLVIESPVTQQQKLDALAAGYFDDSNPLLAAFDAVDRDAKACPPLFAAIAASLAARDVSAFKVGEAPMTAAKQTMIELSATACENWIERNRADIMARRIINVHDDIVTPCMVETREREAFVATTLRKWLKRDLGIFALGDVRVRDPGNSKRSRVVKLLALGDFAAEVENYPGGLEGYKAKHDIAATYEAERAAVAKD